MSVSAPMPVSAAPGNPYEDASSNSPSFACPGDRNDCPGPGPGPVSVLDADPDADPDAELEGPVSV